VIGRLTLSYVAVFVVVLAALSLAAFLFLARANHDLLEPLLGSPTGAAVYAAALRRIALGIAAFDVPLLGLVALASYALARLSLRPLEAARAREARFVADAAHELRTPLAAIATIAQAAPPSADTAAIARIALSASALVSDLLTLVRGEAVAARVREPVGLAAILRAAVAELPAAAEPAAGAARPTSGEPRVDLDAGPEIYVLGEERRLRQLVANLLDNARRHARSAVRLRVFAEGDQAVVEVEDDGPGVDPADRERVFERFFSSRPHGEGSGLGLAIARWVARSHGGDVTVAERSRFVTRLPRYVPED
jgi:signal transduction histidine kinase